MKASAENQNDKILPHINVTPLIDVLLVLLIIFMVISPLKPSRFKAMIPQPLPPRDEKHPPDPDPRMLVVTIDKDLSLKLNGITGMGSVNDTGPLSAKLAQIFQARKENHVYGEGMENRWDLPEENRILKLVFIKAPPSIPYGEVTKVIDGVKGAGADPIGLQIDDLN